MLYFASDYMEGAHPQVLEKLMITNMEHLTGYGTDAYCESAKEKIKKVCGLETADVHFLVGGTQTNAIMIDALLKAYERVVCADSGHINTHEAGAIEFTGHKVLSLPGDCGKLKAEELQSYLETFYGDDNHEHAVFPGMVYISHPTEYGTLYSKAELKKLSEVCHKYEMPLYLDGARLGYGLMSSETDVTLNDVAELCDAFYIGGTKVGALCGEAVVFTKNNTPKNFMTVVKQRGALLAKGRLLGVQFDALFTDDLYYKISQHAIEMAEVLKQGLKEKGYRFFLNSPTNQQFIVLENAKMEELKKEVAFSFWEKYDESHTVVRFATSWATTKEDVKALLDLL